MAASSGSSEVAKLQQHLDLLRDQYVKLQQKHAELEQKYTRAIAASGNAGSDHFVSRLLKVVSDLFDKPLYSDLTIMLSDRTLCGHKFILVARSRHWSTNDETLSSTSQLDLSNMTPFVAVGLVRWVYTDVMVLPTDQDAVIELLAASNRYQLTPLKEKCEQSLISTVNVRNCIKLYQTSEEHAAESLKTYCLQIISSHWNNLNTRDFADLSAPLLYDMFKARTEYPLHLAIQHLREDVVFLFLIEYNSQLPHRLNECDNEGNIPLNLALLNRHDGIATTLVSHKCDLDSVDAEGNSLLHLAILRGDSFAALFLIKNGCNTTLSRHSTHETPLHLVSSYNPSRALANVSTASVSKAPWPSDSMVHIASQLLEFKADPNARDCDGCTALHRAIQCGNAEVFNVLLSNDSLDLDLCNNAGDSALWLALSKLDSAYFTSDDITQYNNSFPAKLITRGANPDALDSRTGNILLHRAALESNEAAAIFLVHRGAQLNPKNGEGEAPIHIAARNGLHSLVEVLLQHGADPNQQTSLRAPPSPVSPVPSAAAAATPLAAVPEPFRKRSESPRSLPPSSLPHPPHSSSSSHPSSNTTPSPHSPFSSSQQPAFGVGGGVGGGMMDFDLTSSSAMSSAALGALSALSATSQALSGLQVNYSHFAFT
ncbi:Rabankyrin-5 [Geodia barretti]|uniref:Rabankyrin-5 n=1 Tax=Geodia barretti TaxID=519541 RepID=A0AA35WNN4_GEOBA|nr:Rabankyrin-5 [Geodia barretti]